MESWERRRPVGPHTRMRDGGPRWGGGSQTILVWSTKGQTRLILPYNPTTTVLRELSRLISRVNGLRTSVRSVPVPTRPRWSGYNPGYQTKMVRLSKLDPPTGGGWLWTRTMIKRRWSAPGRVPSNPLKLCAAVSIKAPCSAHRTQSPTSGHQQAQRPQPVCPTPPTADLRPRTGPSGPGPRLAKSCRVPRAQ